MANVLVTGASGFLGLAVMTRVLAGGHSAIGLDPAPAALLQSSDTFRADYANSVQNLSESVK